MQIEEEIGAIFDFMQHIYGLFGFQFHLELSTRPDNYLGAAETWDAAEKVCTFPSHSLDPANCERCKQQLTKALDTFYPGKWELNPGDGAFYGPKIDVTIKDALHRSFQCATIQLDFQLPERFSLKYRSAEEGVVESGGAEGEKAEKAPSRPVMIHRAILGSLERFMAIVTEHFAGKW